MFLPALGDAFIWRRACGFFDLHLFDTLKYDKKKCT